MATPRVRKNIDALTEEEFDNYVHALQAVIDISDADPDSIDGYTYFEQLHDGSLGPCEHANDTFLPWHRAHIYLFEEALRRVDPPRTANVTVPYWDWSALPSGDRYPKRFENAATLLRHNRNGGKICREGGGAQCEALPFPRDYLERNVLANPRWSSTQPASPSSPPQSFGGYAGGESDCESQFGKGFGILETPAHNAMHGAFIGGDMADPSAAALDPIFFSFHAYFDLLWWQWQQMEGHRVDTGLESRLCGLFKDRMHQPQNRFRVKDLLDIEAQLGYTYDYTRPALASRPMAPEQLFETHPAVDLVLSGKSAPTVTRFLDVTVPSSVFAEAALNFKGIKVHTPFSYGADVYLYPADVDFRPRDRGFRVAHLLDFIFVWKAHHGHHETMHGAMDPPSNDIALNVTTALTAIAKAQPARRFRVGIALTPLAVAIGRGMPGMAAAAVDPEAIDFADVNLTVR